MICLIERRKPPDTFPKRFHMYRFFLPKPLDKQGFGFLLIDHFDPPDKRTVLNDRNHIITMQPLMFGFINFPLVIKIENGGYQLSIP
jgi:hypothetical protein